MRINSQQALSAMMFSAFVIWGGVGGGAGLLVQNLSPTITLDIETVQLTHCV